MNSTTLADYTSDFDSGLQKVILQIAHVSADIRGDFADKRGAAETKNVYGETQQKLDVWADKILTEELLKTGEVRAVLSEEQEEATMGDGKYVVSMDPLDGSSNIKSNNMFGTIIGIHDKQDILTAGKNLKVAFYVLYGPLTSIVIASKKGVAEFVYSDNTKNFHLTKDKIKIPKEGKLYGPGGANDGWEKKDLSLMDKLFKRGLKLRYGGAFVGDINQVLTYGGLFFYPANKKKQGGKLRLLIECNPMAYILKKAGGHASDGKQSILDIKPEKIAHRTPIYIGNKDLVAEAEK